MLNYIWLTMVIVAVVLGGINGKIEEVTKSAMDAATGAVTIAIGLVGVMALWLGIVKIAEDSGLMSLLARAIAPIMKRLFPDVPPGHPAMGSMTMNIAANMLGLSNAATPLGIKAMVPWILPPLLERRWERPVVRSLWELLPQKFWKDCPFSQSIARGKPHDSEYYRNHLKLGNSPFSGRSPALWRD
jgi:hypothetical protein